MATTTKQQIANINDFYDRDLLFRAQPRLIHTLFAQVRNLPEKNSDTIKFRRYGDFSAATTPLTEGVTPSGKQLSETTITSTIKQYGDFTTLSDELTMEIEDPIRMETNQILGDQAGKTLDILASDELSNGTNVEYAGGRTSRSNIQSGDTISGTEVDNAINTLKNNNAMELTSMVEASTGIKTEPIDKAFIGFVHPNVTDDLTGLSDFTRVENYADIGQRFQGEVGKYKKVRFIESTNTKVFAGAGSSGEDVYSTVILADRAYATSRISGNAMSNIVKPLGSGGTNDPLEQRETSGWKATFATKILNNDFVVRVESAGS